MIWKKITIYVENFTDKEKQLLIYIGYLIMDSDRLNAKIMKEVFEEFDFDPTNIADGLLEKLTDLV